MLELPVTLTSFLRYILSRNKKWFFIGILVRILWALESSVTPYVLKCIIDKIAYIGASPTLFSAMMPLIVCYALLWCARGIYFRIWDLVDLKFEPSVKKDVSIHMFSHLSGHSHRYFQNNPTGSLQNKITDMTDSTAVLLYMFNDSIGCSLMLLISLISTAIIAPIFCMIFLGLIISFILIFLLFSKKIGTQTRLFAMARNAYMGNMTDSLMNMMTIRLFSKRRYEVDYHKKALKDTIAQEQAMKRTILYMRIGWDVAILSTMIGLLLLLIFRYSQGKATLGDFIFIINLGVDLFHTIWWFLNSHRDFFERVGRCKEGIKILNTPYEIVDAPKAKPLQVSQGEIHVKDLSFSYEEDNVIFNKKNIYIAPKERVGLVGSSGGGKTTLINLLIRLFDPQEGTISIDGQDIKEVMINSLYDKISLIPQHTQLFNRTLMENIRYGNLKATDEEVIAAAKKAHCHTFIQGLSEQYDTVVDEQGLNLSGGQRQRIAIARGFLKNAPILILDEATSALDSITEKYIQKSLATLMQGRTVIVIAHRLATLTAMDRILVFDKGKTIEEGNHQALLEKGGLYAKMWTMQASRLLPG